jgi:YD repeat-containing protein
LGYVETAPNTYRYFCRITFPDIEPAPKATTCNPVQITQREKIQTEVDYSAPSGLSFSRTMRSRTGGFSQLQSTRMIDRSGVDPLGSCLPATYMKPGDGSNPATSDTYCFPYVGSGVQEYQLLKSNGYTTKFSGTASAPTQAANLNDRAVQLIDGQGRKTWRVKTENDTIELYGADGLLQSRTAPNGQAMSFTYTNGYMASQTDAFGRKLQWSYNTQGRLLQMIDPAGGVYDYSYDANLNQSGVTFPTDGQGVRRTRTYHWETTYAGYNGNTFYAFTGITDEKGNRFSTYTYDTTGKVTETKHFAAPAVEVNRHTFAGTNPVTVTDPLGAARDYSSTNILNYDYVTSASQPAGAGCGPASSAVSYDTQGNAVSRDDFTGKRSCHKYDLSRNLETARLEGLTNATACPTDAAAYAVPAPVGANVGQRKVSTTWHPDWRLEVRRAEPKRITTWVYNGQPDPTAANAVASCAPAIALLPDGKPIAVLCKQVEQATTDATGTAGFSATASGTARIWTYTYNGYGQVLTADGPRTDAGIVDKTTYTYYSSTDTATPPAYTLGDLATMSNAAGHVTTYNRYDKNGRLLKMTDANGTVTDMTYHPRGWLLSRTVTASSASAGERTSYDYEPTGKLSKLTLPDGSTITYSYDGAQRLTGMIDSLGNSVAYTLDAMGNRTKEEVKDPGGTLARNIARAYDALNRLQSVTGGVQ